MTEDMRVSGGTGLPAEISVNEQAQAAGRQPPSFLQNGELYHLKAHCLTVINQLPGDRHANGILQAKAKLEEMCYWLSYHLTTQRLAKPEA